MLDHFGDNVVALVWSFKDKMKDDPYHICRYGSSKKEGGTGYKWTCSCASFIYGGSRTCKHLINLRKEARDGTLLSDDRYKISEYGMKVLKLDK